MPRKGSTGPSIKTESNDLVDEIIQLNSGRHRSFFHVGFRDAVLGRGMAEALPAQNSERLQWYWCGHLMGLARQERWWDIVLHFDKQEAVKRISHTLGPLGDQAVILLFRALSSQGRPGEGAGFLLRRS
jgi:hypothetical protein